MHEGQADGKSGKRKFARLHRKVFGGFNGNLQCVATLRNTI